MPLGSNWKTKRRRSQLACDVFGSRRVWCRLWTGRVSDVGWHCDEGDLGHNISKGWSLAPFRAKQLEKKGAQTWCRSTSFFRTCWNGKDCERLKAIKLFQNIPSYLGSSATWALGEKLDDKEIQLYRKTAKEIGETTERGLTTWEQSARRPYLDSNLRPYQPSLARST